MHDLEVPGRTGIERASSTPGRLPRGSQPPLLVVTVLASAPDWAGEGPLVVVASESQLVLEQAAELAREDAQGIVLVDAAVLEPVDADWIAELRAAFGPVIAVGGQPGGHVVARMCRVDGYLPESFLHVPGELAHKVLLDCSQASQVSAERMERFMRDAIHEFRTPLTVITEFTALCEEGVGGPITEKQRQYLAHIQRAAARMCQEFDDYRDAIRLQLGTLSLGVDRSSLASIVEAAVREFDCDAHIVEPVDAAVALNGVDAARLHAALLRMLAVAMKFKRSGEGIRITVQPNRSSHDIALQFIGLLPSEDDMEVLETGFVATEGGPYRTVARVFGLGAAMAHLFLHESGGSMRLERRGATGGAFILTVPTVSRASAAPIAA